MGNLGFILSIASFVCSLVPGIGILVSIIALIISVVAVIKNKSRNDRTFAILGVIYSSLGYIMSVGISIGAITIMIFNIN